MLLNVRLTIEEERAVRGLRRAKVNVSELVRRALREAAAVGASVKLRRSFLVKEIIEALPGPKRRGRGPRPRLDDRRAVAALIRRRLSGK